MAGGVGALGDLEPLDSPPLGLSLFVERWWRW
jgi:hypothetical protein